MTPSGERRWDRLRIAHGLLFAVAVAAAAVDLASSSGFDGSGFASAFSVPLVGLALGVALVATGRPGGRAMLVVADVALVAGAAASVLTSTTGPFGSPDSAVLAAVVGGFAALALLVGIATQRPPGPEVPRRTVGHRLAAAALLGFTVITLAAPYLSMRDLPTAPILLAAVPTLVGVAVALTAWWYGSGWLLALFGIGSLAASLDVVLALAAPPSWNHLILGIGAIVMGLRAPTLPSADGLPSPTAAGDGVGSHPSRRSRPTSAAVWAGLGAVLFVPTVLLGRWTPGFVDCFDACPPLSPLAEATVPLTWLAVVFVPLAAIAVALEPRSRPGASVWIAVVGLVGAAVVLGQVALGIAGIEPFTYMTIGAPAAVLCATGFVGALAAPRWLARTGRVAAVGSAVAGLLWMAEGLGAGGAIFDLPLVEAASLVTGAVVIVALGRAFGEGTVELPGPAGSDVDMTTAPAVVEGP